MQRPGLRIAHASRFSRSRVTNGRLPIGIDGRSLAARRFRDLVQAYEAEFEVATQLDRNLIRSTWLLRFFLA
jgi:hypothetical protein